MTDPTIEQVMRAMPGAFQAEDAGNTNATLQFHFSGDQASDWVVRISEGACTTQPGTTDSANVTLTIDSDDFLDLLAGRLEPMAAFMRGKLQLRGDVALAMRLPKLFKRG